jgi:immunoglobulin-binding protein 1
MSNLSLKDLFNDALVLKESLGSLRPSSAEYRENLSKTVALLEQCKDLVDRMGLYSTNETSEDLSTNDIRYLSVNFHLASVVDRVFSEETSKRLATIKRAAELHFCYLIELNSYKILPKSIASKIQEAIETDKSNFPRLQSSNAVDKRAEKIELFKLERSLEQKLDQYKESADEDIIRNMEFARLGIYAIKALSSLETLNMEIDLLKSMPDKPEPTAPKTGADSRIKHRNEEQYRTKVEQINQPLLSAKGKVNRPFTLVSSRDQMKRNVLGSGQYLPTMTVEEYLEEELKRGGIIQGGGETSAVKDDGNDEDDMEKQDQETYKQRAWDEFVEANPRGSGNTINRG